MVKFEFLDGLDVESMLVDQYYLIELKANEGDMETHIVGVMLYRGQSTEGCCMFNPFEKAPDNELMMGEAFYEPFLDDDNDHLKVTVVSQMGRVGCQRPCPAPSENEMMFGVESPGGN